MTKKRAALNVETIAIDDLKPYARNARTHPKKQVEALAQSMRQFGWTSPLLISADLEVVGGHGRLLAAILIREKRHEIPGWEDIATVPALRLDGLTPEQIKAYRVADNKLAELGGWDMDLLTQELGELQDSAFNLDLTGFLDGEFEDLKASLGRTGGRRSRGSNGTPVISYSIVFADTEQRKTWLQFMKHLKLTYPDAKTIAERLLLHVGERGPEK